MNNKSNLLNNEGASISTVPLHGIRFSGLPMSKFYTYPSSPVNPYIAGRYPVSSWTLIVVAYHVSNHKQSKLYKSGSVTTTTSPMKPRHTAEANDSIKELFPEREGEQQVPEPILEIGCEVGLHGGKWVIDCEVNQKRFSNERLWKLPKLH